MRNKENRTKTVLFRCTEEELNHLIELSKDYKSVSDFVRRKTLKSGSSLVNPGEFIQAVDGISSEIKRIGNNINQFAKIANQRKDVSNDTILEQYNILLGQYIREERKIEMLYRKIMAI